MMKSYSTKRSLITSLIALMLCFSMLLGTTFAWFTDSVTSSGNKIVSGTLDVQLLMHNGTEYEDISDATSPIFGAEDSLMAQNNAADTLWEPGKTQIVYLAVKNAGSLALKYNVVLDVEDLGLIGALDYAIIDGATKADFEALGATKWSDVLAVDGVQSALIAEGRTVAAPYGALEAGQYDYFALAVHMKEEAGNEYQDKSIVIDINVVATQLTAEDDSFDDQYDADAELPQVKLPPQKIKVTTVDELVTALSSLTGDAVVDATGVEVKMSEIATSSGSHLTKEVKAGVTIKGLDLTFDVTNATIVTRAGTESDSIAFENCTFRSENSFSSQVYFQSGTDASGTKLVFNNCTFIAAKAIFAGNTGGGIEYNNCKFELIPSGYGLVQCMGGDHAFNGCKFNISGSKSIGSSAITKYGNLNLYSERYNTNVTLDGCTGTPAVHKYNYGGGVGTIVTK